MKKVFTFLLFIIVAVFTLSAQMLNTVPVNLALNNDIEKAILTTTTQDLILNNHFKGIITTPNNLPVNNVLVKLNNLSYTTGQDGVFDFDISLVKNPGDLKLSFSKDDNAKNGVSALDVFLIRQHLLHQNTFKDTWKQQAGDVNSNSSLSTVDLAQINDLLLGKLNSFEPNISWRFLSKDIKYDASNPDCIYSIKAIKLGDVSGNANPSKFINDELEVRGDPIIISSKNIRLFANKSYRIDFNIERKEDISALQFTLEAFKKAIDIQSVIPGKIASFSELNYSLFTKDNLLTVSWDNVDDISFPTKYVFFTLIINVNRDIDLTDAFKISSKVTKSVGYNSKGESVPISLNINGDADELFPLVFNYGPNPVQDKLQVNMDLPKDTKLKMYLVDNLGRSFRPVFDDTLEKGHQSFSLDFPSYTNGIYYLQVELDGVKQPLQKLMLYR